MLQHFSSVSFVKLLKILSTFTSFLRRRPREPGCDGRHGCDAEHHSPKSAHVRDSAVWGWHRGGGSALWVSIEPCVPANIVTSHIYVIHTLTNCYMLKAGLKNVYVFLRSQIT
jgi:hypothetical protein